MQEFQAIDAVRYLTAENSGRYRAIMRIFYTAYEQVCYQLGKEEIAKQIPNDGIFEDYSMDMLKQDLSNLVEWGSLTAIQDTKRVYTIAEYKNKQFRYSMTEYAVEIERLTVVLDNLYVESGTLSPNLFLRIYDALNSWETMLDAPLDAVNALWRGIQDDFKRLNQNYQDYLREFYSEQSGKLLQSLEFLRHKDLFITYLRDFVRGIQTHSNRMRLVLSRMPDEAEARLMERVVDSELAIPQPLMVQQDREERLRARVLGKWDSLKRWFVPGADGVCESNRVRDITNDIIYKIIKNAELILQLQDWGMSRKEEYRRYMALFQEAPDLDEAHRLAAHLFGIQHIGHYRANAPRQTEDVGSGVYDEAPLVYRVTPSTRTYRERIERRGFPDRSVQRSLARTRYLNQIASQQRMAEGYIREGRLSIRDIDTTVPAAFRRVLLGWIAQAGKNASKESRTEYGRYFQLVRDEGECTLHCEDGDLKMPAYTLIFMEEG